jgi:tetratricopeptide (TPR) repeat protein
LTGTNQTAGNLPNGKRFSKRLWFGAIAAVLLVTLPVLPPNPFTAFSPNRINVDTIKGMIGAALHQPFPGDADYNTDEANPSDFRPSANVAAEDVRSLSRAVEQLNGQISNFPDDPSLHNRIGILYAQLGEFPCAIEHFNHAIDLCHQRILSLSASKKGGQAGGNNSETSVLAGSQLSVDLSAAHSNLARIYDAMGQHERVVAQLDQLNRDIVFAGDFSRSTKHGKGEALLTDGETRLTSSIAASLARGQALLQARRVPEAIQEYQNLIKSEPKVALAHHQLGLIFVRQNDLSSAIPELEAATHLEPQDANTRNNLGLAYLERGDKQLAKAEFSRACSLEPKNMDAAINLANLLAEDGEYESAIKTLKTSLAFNPRSAAGHNNFASLLSITGKLREAIAEFQVALSLKPDMSTAHYGLGLALFKSQSYQASIKEFKLALALNPALIDAQNKIEQAYRKNELAVNSAPGIN